LANGLPGQPLGTPPGIPGQPSGSPPGLPAGPPPGLPSSIIAQLAARERPNALDKIRRAVVLLEESRELDPKSASAISMALHILRNGQRGLSDFQEDSPGRFPEGKTGVRGVVG